MVAVGVFEGIGVRGCARVLAVGCAEVEDFGEPGGEEGADGRETGAYESDAYFDVGPDCGVGVVPCWKCIRGLFLR